MKKSERLNDMIRYLNDRSFFNLKELMERYTISKSTALRDVRSLEELGMPIYTEYGRYGKYGILQNRLLSPILFTIDEIYALYFAMLTLEAYQSSPFHLSVKKLNENFEKCLSKDQWQHLHKMKKVLNFESYPHPNVSSFLDQILESILTGNECTVSYLKGEVEQVYSVQFFKISAKFGQWYVSGINLKTKRMIVFRGDKITSFDVENRPSSFLSEELLQLSIHQQTKLGTDFEVEIKEQAKDLFYKENYPSMKLIETDKIIIKGSYQQHEVPFIANYLLRYGETILAIRPPALKKIVENRINELAKYYQNIK